LLGQLAGTHRHFTLFVFAEARVLFDPISNQPGAWTETLGEWSSRVLFTPEPPAQWTRRESTLTESGMVVLPWGAPTQRVAPAAVQRPRRTNGRRRVPA